MPPKLNPSQQRCQRERLQGISGELARLVVSLESALARAQVAQKRLVEIMGSDEEAVR